MEKKHRVLIVDDVEANRIALSQILKSLGHETEVACDGFEALSKLKEDIDLVLLDVMMPGMDGYETTRLIRRNKDLSDIPIIIVTNLVSKADRLRAVEAGANDFIGKPVDRIELRVRMASLLKMKEALDTIKRHKALLEETVLQRTKALREALHDMTLAQQEAQEAHLETVRRLAMAAEYRDDDTGAHIMRVTFYTSLIVRTVKMPGDEAEIVQYASAMHDMGKIAIPDGILLKPGKLNEDEWSIMRKHPLIGARILSGSQSKLLKAAEIIASSHHEKWDGSGYPNGLAGDDIPIYGRICAVSDVFDALTSERPYKLPFEASKAFRILREGSGKHFDPDIVNAFLLNTDKILDFLKNGHNKKNHRDT